MPGIHHMFKAVSLSVRGKTNFNRVQSQCDRVQEMLVGYSVTGVQEMLVGYSVTGAQEM